MRIKTNIVTRAGCVLLALMPALVQAQNPARRATDDPEPAASENRFVVQFRSYNASARATVTGAGGQVVYEFPALRAIAARLPALAALALQNNPNVEFVEADARRYPMGAGTAHTRLETSAGQVVPYGISMVQADQIVGANPSNRKVCIIDSGYYLGHEDLPQANVSGSADGGAGAWSQDGFGHGTHVAGTISALNNSVGVVGVNPGGLLNLHIVRVFGNDGKWAYSSRLVAALNQCLAANANIVSMSLGGPIPTRFENQAFANAYASGVLLVAAAGNDGNRRTSYPAGYDSVISVAAVDHNRKVASFSQANFDVELSAPGVGVLSTLPYIENVAVTSVGNTISGTWVEFSQRTPGVTAVLVDGGLCSAVNATWKSQIVLCQRGTSSFYEKVHNAELSGAVGVVLYNNEAGALSATLGDGNSSTIPAVGVTQADGSALKSTGVGQNATIVSTRQAPASGYEAWDGTSMATPHVSGVAALIWSFNPAWTNEQVRKAMQATALDLGFRRRDAAYGFGLVQAKAALTYLQTH